ncbi:MAG TPA: hypothetical protein VKS81_11895 [Bacteroidota bacterium]|nr:hypothetical protein [Bacteroidota bacterium]
MKRILFILGIIAAMAFLAGCGGGGNSASGDSVYIPQWPEDTGFIYGLANEKSADMELAIDKATASARTKIAQSIKTRVDDDTKRMKQEAGQQDSMNVTKFFSQASELITSESLTGSTMDKQEVKKEGAIYSAWVRVKYPKGGVDQSVVNKVKDEQEMYARFRATQAFKDLNDSVEKMKKDENKQ